jgi:isoleucyl-tRNA synthetase
VGLTYRPLFPGSAKHEVYRVVPAPHVTATSGTGLVHCAPAHGVEDYNAFRALGMLPRSVDMVCHVDLAGKFTEDISAVVGEDNARRLVGLEALYRGGKEMVEILRELNGEHGGGRLVREEKIRHRYPYDWKTGKPIIIL